MILNTTSSSPMEYLKASQLRESYISRYSGGTQTASHVGCRPLVRDYIACQGLLFPALAELRLPKIWTRSLLTYDVRRDRFNTAKNRSIVHGALPYVTQPNFEIFNVAWRRLLPTTHLMAQDSLGQLAQMSCPVSVAAQLLKYPLHMSPALRSRFISVDLDTLVRYPSTPW